MTMFRQSLLGSFLLVAMASCQQNNPSSKPAAKNITDTVTAVPATTGKTEAHQHEAFNDEITDLPPALSAFVPAGYTVLDTAIGDLNQDPLADIIMVLKKNGEDTTSDVTDHPEHRPLLLLLGQEDHSYKLAARNDKAVYCIDCGGMMGDPFMNVVIKNGYFSIEHYGGSAWRWTRTITFKYDPAGKSWYLHKDGGDSFHASEPEKVTTKVKTTRDFGKVPFTDFDIYKEQEE